MMHPSIEAVSQIEIIKKKVNELKSTRGLTLKEIDGQLRFMTDAIIKLEEEKQENTLVHRNDHLLSLHWENMQELQTTLPLLLR